MLLVAVPLAVVTSGGVAAVAVLTSSEGPSGQPRTSAPATTAVRHYQPWAGARPAPDLHVVTAAGNADCWEGSIVSPRSDAYRCSTRATYDGGNLFDPCFAAAGNAHRLLCPGEPLSARRALAITSAHPGPANSPRAADVHAPWDIELAGDVTCRDVSGATASVAGLRANYDCSDGRVLWGDPNGSTPLWTMRSSASYRPTHFDTVVLAAVWF
jgi:hypothetical protein